MIALISRNKSLLATLIIVMMVTFFANLNAQKEQSVKKFHTKQEREKLRQLLRVQPVGTNSLFAGSGLCGGCHGHDPNGLALIDPITLHDINMTDDWAATMMANSAKDPLWRAKVSHEILVNPSHQIALEDKCTSCHAPQGRANAIHEGQSTYAIADMIGDSVALDGVACGACHQLKDTLTGKLFSGTMIYDTTKTVYGPYDNPFQGPMQSFIGFDVKQGLHIPSSGLCAGCHTLLTETVDLSGNFTGTHFVEQATYHEWLNSSYATSLDKTCQKCHIPQIDENVIIAANFQFLAPRRPFGKHHLVGGNSFMVRLIKDNIAALGATAAPWMFDTVISRTNRYLRDSTLNMNLTETNRTADTVFYDLSLENRAGHKFPSGYPSRLAFVEFVVMDDLGDTIFKSGMLDPNFNIINRDATFEPHYNMINSEQQVQIYEMVMGDVNSNPTTVLERASSHLKDNRLTPIGFTTSHYAYDTTQIVGGASSDPDFNKAGMTEGTGSDIIHFHIPLAGYSGALNVSARVYYQSVPRKWLDEMFTFSSTEIDTFQTMYNNANHTPALVAEVLMGDIFTIGVLEKALNKLVVYPNPSNNGAIEVKGISFENIDEIMVIDMQGKMFNPDLSLFWLTGKIYLPSNQKGTFVLVVKTKDGKILREKLVVI